MTEQSNKYAAIKGVKKKKILQRGSHIVVLFWDRAQPGLECFSLFVKRGPWMCSKRAICFLIVFKAAKSGEGGRPVPSYFKPHSRASGFDFWTNFFPGHGRPRIRIGWLFSEWAHPIWTNRALPATKGDKPS